MHLTHFSNRLTEDYQYIYLLCRGMLFSLLFPPLRPIIIITFQEQWNKKILDSSSPPRDQHNASIVCSYVAVTKCLEYWKHYYVQHMYHDNLRHDMVSSQKYSIKTRLYQFVNEIKSYQLSLYVEMAIFKWTTYHMDFWNTEHLIKKP